MAGMAEAAQYATGKRKVAIARAWMSPGNGQITVNDRTFENYFPRPSLRSLIQYPIEVTGLTGKYDVNATLSGGGPTGQAGALRHAIAKALVIMTPALRQVLKKEGLLTRDSRVKERKKYGQKGARKRFQYSKR
jgi:small subunit ribosomal protein S9